MLGSFRINFTYTKVPERPSTTTTTPAAIPATRAMSVLDVEESVSGANSLSTLSRPFPDGCSPWKFPTSDGSASGESRTSGGGGLGLGGGGEGDTGGGDGEGGEGGGEGGGGDDEGGGEGGGGDGGGGGETSK